MTPTRILTGWLALLLAVAGLPATSQPADLSARGVIVESVQPGYALAKAGVRPGDIILGWEVRDSTRSTGDSIDSPVGFALAEVGHGHLQGLVLVAERAGRRIELPAPPLQWRAEVRPRFTATQLKAFEDAAAAIKAARWDDAARSFDSLAAECAGQRRIEDAVWLLEKAATARRSQQRFEAATALTDRAVQLAESSRLPDLAAWARHRAGADLRARDRTQEAEQYFAAVVRAGEPLASANLLAARALLAMADMASTQGKYPQASTYAGRALEITRTAAPGSFLEAEAYHVLGNTAFWSEELDAAEEHLQRSLAIRSRIDPSGISEARSLLPLGNVRARRGQFTAAKQYYEKALATFDRFVPDSSYTGQTLIVLGNIVQQRRDLASAEHYRLRALAIFEKIAPHGEHMAEIYLSLGEIQRLRGDLAGAQAFIDKALAIFRRVAPGGLQESLALAKLGDVALDQGDLAGARRYQSASLELTHQLSPRGQRIGERLLSLGRVEIESGERVAAKRYLAEALTIFERTAPDGLAVADALTAVAQLNIDGVGVAVARRQLLRAAQIAGRLAPGTEREAEPLYHLARLERAAGDANRARTLFARALDALESQRSVLGGSDESHAHFSERYARYYLDYIELLIEHGKLEEAFSASERYRARALLEAFVSRHDIAVAGLPRALADEQERAAFRYEEALERVRRYGEPQRRATTFQQEVRALEMARIERNAIEDRVRALTAQRPVATLAQPWSARQVSSRLKRDAALLSYLQTSEAMHLFVIDGAAARDAAVVVSFRIGDVTRLQEEIEAVHVLMRAHVNTPESQGALFKRLAGLHAKLIAPAAAVLRGKQQLIIVPDGALHRVPWLALAADVGAALESSPRFLIADHAVLVAPSATFYVKAQLDEPAQAGRKTSIVAFAGGAQADASSDPNPSETAARTAVGGAVSVMLPFAVKETAAIKRAFGASAIIFSGAQATESRAKQVAASAGMLHFATHAVAMESSPLDSYIALAPDRTNPVAGDNGLLHAWEVVGQLRLHSAVVVLSACETGGGREAAGEGLLGLTRAFHYAGARGVVSSLWPVSDRATSELMRRFYERIAAGDPVESALRTAQLAMLRAEDRSWFDSLLAADVDSRRVWRHPFYWAGFQLSGTAN